MTALAALSLVSPAAESAVACSLRFSVPVLDQEEFAKLSAKRRQEVTLSLRLLERVHAMAGEPGFVRAVHTLANGYRHLRGLSGASLLRKYYAYLEGGDWRSLVKGYKGHGTLPAAFQEFVKGLIEQNARSVEEALRVLREEIWANGSPVPGYGTWQEWFTATYPGQPVPRVFPRVFPRGWSVPNLRRYGPSKAEKKLFQRGLAAAHAHLPTILRDTSRLRPMEWIVVDDFELDTMCCFRGDPERGLPPQIAYVAGLLAMDVGSRKSLARLLGPRVEREEKLPDGTVQKVRCNIRAVDVQVLLHEIFRQHGLPDYEVTILCENATAAISPDLELMLGTIYEGRIKVARTSMIEHRTLANGFVERGGTPWEKGWIESHFNKLWNMLARLPGYKGSNQRLNAPADFEDKLRTATKLLGGGASKMHLPPELVDEMRLPFMSLEQLEQAFDWALDQAERRTKHRCQGFDTVTEFRWAHPALPAPAGIDAHEPNTFRALAVLTPEQQALMLPEERKESPLERWERLTARHPRSALAPSVLALFLLTPKKAAWRGHTVTFTHQKVGYSYVDDDGIMAGFPEGTDLLVYVDLQRPGAALVARLDGTPIGTLRMLGGSTRGVDITDKAALDEARARRATIVNRVLAGVRARPLHQAANEQLGQDRQHNDAIIAAWQREVKPTVAAPRASASEISPLQSQVATSQEAASHRAEVDAALRRSDDFDPSALL
jgi:hypothetical protein